MFLQNTLNFRPGRGKDAAKVTDIRALPYTASGDIHFKVRFSNKWEVIPQRKSPVAVSLPFSHLPNLYESRRTIARRKYEISSISNDYFLKITTPTITIYLMIE
ncbi:PREDICTED: uncharacterized protein LOC108374140 [Rhagoletis zephyria]|uniref:uncharacterized protein LOC108374140 n=1 Tax=Rhagoletis zephyria TaxID=28612 RepID=UPI0008113B6E|nr:PREDICTED: uncharacterized protein LOC108374140 [Rhagoletis zephyria]